MLKSEKIKLFRDRFHGRQEFYGRRWESKGGSGYSPVCDNFWKDFCHIKLKDGVPCSDCKHAKLAPVSDESVWKHIKGEEAHIQYVLQPDGHIYFGALDFDCKPGKEKEGYYFEDVLLAHQTLNEFGITNYMARSTGKGYHIYMFFDGKVKANEFRCIMLYLFQVTGFQALSNQNIRMNPEVFPKQSGLGLDGKGNGIKCPMIEPNMEDGKNCFVNEENAPYENQWEFLASTKKNDPSIIEQIIKKYEVVIMEDFNNTHAGNRGKSGNSNHQAGNVGAYQRPRDGYIKPMLNACPAYKALWEKIQKGHVPTHNEGFALWHASLSTKDGEEWFLNNMPGWPSNDAERRQLEYSKSKGYKPDTCKTLQEKGICPKGMKCLDPQPPVIKVNGQFVLEEGVPESKWPDPSPIRFALRAGKEPYLDLLKEKARELAEVPDRSNIGLPLNDLINQAMVFDITQQTRFKKYLAEDLKIDKISNLNRVFKAAAATAKEEDKKAVESRSDMVFVNNTTYQSIADGGYATVKEIDGRSVIAPVCDFNLEIIEERVYIDENKEDSRVYIGRFKATGFEKDFEITTDMWQDNAEMMKYFTKLCGTKFNVPRQNLDHIRQASIAFSYMEGIQVTNYFITQGWHDEAYLMPDAQVDKNGVQANTEKKIDLTCKNKESAQHLNFMLTDESAFKDLLFHVKAELFNTFPRKALFTALSHTLQAGIHAKLGVNQRPTVWIEGDTGSGKSSLTQVLQRFWGKFEKCLNWDTTLRSMMEGAYNFKDACLIIDDYKARANQPEKAKTILQYCYDPTVRGALRRDGTQRGDRSSRCLILCSGELTPDNEASVISRIILVKYPEVNKYKTADLYSKVNDRSYDYSSITPRFIHYCIDVGMENIRERRKEISKEFLKPVQDTRNGTRISGNFAMNYLTWELFVNFMLTSGVIDHTEAGKLKEEHKKYCLDMIKYTIRRCEQESTGVVVAEMLRDNLDNGTLRIKNLDGYDSEHAKIEIGLVKAEDKDPEILYCHPAILSSFVKNMGKSLGIVGTDRSIGESLKSLGYLAKHGKDSPYHQAKVGGRGNKRYFAISLKKLGLSIDKPRVVGGTQDLDVSQPALDDDQVI